MKTCPRMQKIVTKLAKKHGLDLTADQAHLRLDMPSFDRLVIEKVGKYQVSVAHYFEQHGDLVADPEIVFFTGYKEWVPIEITQVISGWRQVAKLSKDGKNIAGFNRRAQADVAMFAETWARNIESQGWLERGKKWEDHNPGGLVRPDWDTLMRWEAEGGCEAACEYQCWVEPDGYCPHGKPSWFLKMGLI
ncbi:MAG: hypothetical protein ACE5LU_22660 [Anaerolineae bacterium]